MDINFTSPFHWDFERSKHCAIFEAITRNIAVPDETQPTNITLEQMEQLKWIDSHGRGYKISMNDKSKNEGITIQSLMKVEEVDRIGTNQTRCEYIMNLSMFNSSAIQRITSYTDSEGEWHPQFANMNLKMKNRCVFETLRNKYSKKVPSLLKDKFLLEKLGLWNYDET